MNLNKNIDNFNDNPFYYDIGENATVFSPFKIKNGSRFTIGSYYKTTFLVDQHFNWFQKLMWKWCFGIKVKDYKEEKLC